MLFPHPADPTLTTDNLMEVVKEVPLHRREGLNESLSVHLVVHVGFHQPVESVEATVNNYVKSPAASWKEVAKALKENDLHKQAEEVTAKYVKGMDVSHVTFLILNQVVDG